MSPEKHVLSKSAFIRGLQCSKSLFLYRHYPQLRDPVPPERQAVFQRGTNIGILAHDLFPGGVDASPKNIRAYGESVTRTRELIAGGTEVIYEAAFQFNRVLAALDMLVKKDGKWYAYEVKSSARVSHSHILDAALQHYVIEQSGILLEDFFLVHLNTEYFRQGAIDPHLLFKMVSVKKKAQAKWDMIGEQIALQKEVLNLPQAPELPIGEHCFSPYPCDFMGHCWKSVPDDSVFNLGGMRKADLFSLYNSGVHKLDQIKDESVFPEEVKIQLQALRTHAPVIDRKRLHEFMAGIRYPLFFLDFETTMPAIPLYEHTHPYQHLPFQYSLHYKKDKDSELTHVEFLAETHVDPRKSFLLSLLEHTAGWGDILVYYATFERSIFNSLKKNFPEYGVEIDKRLARIKDLIIPFADRLYYHPAMKGSSSIKNVLPALVPGFSYEGLKITNGNVAMTVYEQLMTETDLFAQAEKRDALLAYCRMDTLAMVKIFEVLEKEIG
ncbi:MAG TPA: DUF2779 domain-containing protein [Bacteroidia bacterium]|jgi:hypothetical protein|nr:DUF2779 domain-containing protein [Bacteroidia bacterium]